MIHDGKNAIIIEDKLYDAPDMPNQLARYYKYVTAVKLNVLRVAYLPLAPDKPKTIKEEIKNYDEAYKNLIPQIKKRLLTVPAVSKDKNDLTHGWLEKNIGILFIIVAMMTKILQKCLQYNTKICF